jgi:hypothetical protein
MKAVRLGENIGERRGQENREGWIRNETGRKNKSFDFVHTHRISLIRRLKLDTLKALCGFIVSTRQSQETYHV